jgi:DNA-binding HxlR family transcriptional regulator
MERTSFASAPCSIARTLDILGDWWTPLVIRECLYGVHRFDDLQRWLGIGRNILTARLNRLVDQGILTRDRYQERPQRFEYNLTDKGYAAARLLLAMMEFGEAWCFEPGAEPIRLYHRATGRQAKPCLVDAETGEKLDARDLYAGPGPSFPHARSLRQERFTEYYQRLLAHAPESIEEQAAVLQPVLASSKPSRHPPSKPRAKSIAKSRQ